MRQHAENKDVRHRLTLNVLFHFACQMNSRPLGAVSTRSLSFMYTVNTENYMPSKWLYSRRPFALLREPLGLSSRVSVHRHHVVTQTRFVLGNDLSGRVLDGRGAVPELPPRCGHLEEDSSSRGFDDF